ncbi:unnamed protein product [Rhodiola kirilowii]
MCSNMSWSSQLLELAACDDLVGFTRVVEEEEGCDIDGVGLWYGMWIGTKKMGLEERTPLMIAAMFGSLHVLSYILEKDCVDVNRICGSDGATALHCAIAGGAATASQVVKLLIDASADCNLVGAYTSNLDVLIARVARVANILKPFYGAELASDPFDQELCGEEDRPMDMGISATEPSRDALEKKDYLIDLSLPDIKNGIFSTDEFRMYSFKIRPCSRAYSHDWTECPFVHPGENARRRDPRKHHYSCVPCPEFRKGACHQGDACEYAHGIFECWLHPAQYRTRLCKDETGCNRRVCFFAHKPEELRPLYASTGSAIPSPRSYTASGQLDISSLSPLHLGSPSTSTPPMTPTGLSSPRSGPMWQNQSNTFASNPLAYNSRLKSTLSARDMDFDTADQHGPAEFQRRQQQHLMDEMYGFYSPSSQNQPFESNSPAARVGEFNHLMGRKSSNLDDMFASVDHSVMSQLKCLSVDVNHQLRASYPTNLPSSPARLSSFGIDPSRSSSATAYLNLRSTAFAKRSQSFIERSPTNQNSGFSSPAPSSLHGWGSPTGKLDWGVQGKELNKLRKSASFGIRSNGRGSTSSISGEPEMCWASPRMKDTLPLDRLDEEGRAQYHLNSGGSGNIPTWVEQMYLDQEQTVAH